MRSRTRMNRAAWLIVGIAILSIVATSVLVASGKRGMGVSPPGPYALRVQGSMDTAERLGNPLLLTIAVHNTGMPLPRFAIVFHGLDHWLVDDVTSSLVPNPAPVTSGQGYVFGSLARGALLSITLQITPKDTGSHTINMTSFANADAYGSIASASQIARGGTASWTASIQQ